MSRSPSRGVGEKCEVRKLIFSQFLYFIVTIYYVLIIIMPRSVMFFVFLELLMCIGRPQVVKSCVSLNNVLQ